MDRTNPGGGGMTGATGDLTPDDSTAAFEPGEVREVAGSESHADVTVSQGRHAQAQSGDPGTPGDADAPADDPAPGETHIGGDDLEGEPEHF
ncbi:MAG: hypothetical protein ACR2K4_03690 [Candidatus Limnocylindria bacterium]